MINDADLEALPAESEAAFVGLVDILNQRLDKGWDDNWYDYAQQYVQILLAFIDEHDLERGMGFTVDRSQPRENFREWFDVFRNTINYYQARYRFRSRGVLSPAVAVILPNQSRQEIHGLLNKVRKIVATLDISERKRDAIYDKLGKLQAEIDRSRTKIDALMALILEVSDTAGEASKNLEPAVKLIERVRDIFVGVRDSAEPKLLNGPAGSEGIKRIQGPAQPEGESAPDSDDDIPF